VSALQLACIHNTPATVRALLRRPLPECNPDAAGGWGGETPLHTCAQYGGLECAMALLSAGADPRTRSGGARGKTAAALAAEKAAKASGAAEKWTAEALAALRGAARRSAARTRARIGRRSALTKAAGDET
jgi:ankyrin repeat protein